jgi:hypothetical protein
MNYRKKVEGVCSNCFRADQIGVYHLPDVRGTCEYRGGWRHGGREKIGGPIWREN